MINRDLIAVIGQPVRVGSLNGTITLRAITPEPLELGLIIGGPIGARAHHLAARQRLGQTIGARTRIRCGDAPAGLVGDDVYGGGEIGFGVAVR